MFGTLIAQEVRLTYKPFIQLYVWTTLLAVSSGLFVITRLPLLSNLGSVMLTAVTMAIIPSTIVLLCVFYWQSMHGQHAVFTHSIPARGRTLFAAKACHMLGATVVGALATCVHAAWSYIATGIGQGQSFTETSTALWHTVDGVYHVLRDKGVFGLLFLSLAVMLVSLLQIPAALSIGASGRMPIQGPVGPALAMFALYVANQVGGFIGTVFVPWSVRVDGPDAGAIVYEMMLPEFLEAVQTGGDAPIVGLGSVIFYLLISVCAVWLAIRSLERHLEV